MRLFHTTLQRFVPSIREHGLLTACSKRGMAAVWLHTESRAGWACGHVASKLLSRPEELVVVEVDVPRAWLRRYADGVWYTRRDVPAGRIVSITGFAPVTL